MRVCFIETKNFSPGSLAPFKSGDKLVLIISQDTVLSEDIYFFQELKQEIALAPFRFNNSICLSFQGYDDDIREIQEIPEIRRYFSSVIQTIPHLLPYLNRQGVDGQSDFETYFLLLMELEYTGENIGVIKYSVNISDQLELFNMSLSAVRDCFTKSNLDCSLLIEELLAKYNSIYSQ